MYINSGFRHCTTDMSGSDVNSQRCVKPKHYMYAKMEDEFAQLMAKAAANKDEARRELENVAKAKKLAEQKQRQEYERRRQLAEEARRKKLLERQIKERQEKRAAESQLRVPKREGKNPHQAKKSANTEPKLKPTPKHIVAQLSADINSPKTMKVTVPKSIVKVAPAAHGNASQLPPVKKRPAGDIDYEALLNKARETSTAGSDKALVAQTSNRNDSNRSSGGNMQGRHKLKQTEPHLRDTASVGDRVNKDTEGRSKAQASVTNISGARVSQSLRSSDIVRQKDAEIKRLKQELEQLRQGSISPAKATDKSSKVTVPTSSVKTTTARAAGKNGRKEAGEFAKPAQRPESAKVETRDKERERAAFREKQRQELLMKREAEAARLGRKIDVVPSLKAREVNNRRITRQSVDSFIEHDDGFDDEDREAMEMLRSMTKYDPSKYRGRDYDDPNMEASTFDVMREESRSRRLGYLEDLEEEERELRGAKRRKVR